MKFISLIFIFVLMYSTWGMVHAPRTVSQAVHLGIQEDLKAMIADYIQANLPNSQNLEFERFWTEQTREKQIKASFIYSFEDETAVMGAARVAIEGYALLHRKEDEEGRTQIWSMDELYVLNNKVEFKEALWVSPDSSGTTESPEPEADITSDEESAAEVE